MDRASLAVEVSIRSLFEAPSVAALGRRLKTPESEALRLPLLARSRPTEIPLSYAQLRLWFLDRLEDSTRGSHTYVVRVGGAARRGF